jgi:hypothetical protein
MRKFPILGSVLALALAGSVVTVPALARTHHHHSTKAHSSKAERAQTADLNKQQLAIAQGQAPANQQAMNANGQQPAQGTPQTQNQNMPADQTMNGGQTAQAPATQGDQQTPAAPSNTQAPPSGQ